MSPQSPAFNHHPSWLTPLLQGIETYESPPDPTIWEPLIERDAYAREIFQEFANYFLAATIPIATPLHAYGPDHIFGIQLHQNLEEIHGWIDWPETIHPDSHPTLCIEVGNRFDYPDHPNILWKTLVKDSHTPIEFDHAVESWTQWLHRRASPPRISPPPTQTLENSVVAKISFFAIFVLIISFASMYLLPMVQGKGLP